MSDAETYPTSIRISKEMRRALERRALADGRSLSNYMVKILSDHILETAEPKPAKLQKLR